MFRFDKPLPRALNLAYWPLWVIVFAGAIRLASLADAPLSHALQAWPEPLRGLFFAITNIGLSEWILLPSLVLAVGGAVTGLLVRRGMLKLAAFQLASLWGFIFAAVGLAGLASNILKRLVGRARPVFLDSPDATAYHHFAFDWRYESFPSGHTTTIFAVAAVVGFLAPRWFWPALGMAVLVGISRIVVGMHYLTDVMGGIVCGILVAWVVRDVFARRGWVFRWRPDDSIVIRPFAALRRVVRNWRRPQRADR